MAHPVVEEMQISAEEILDVIARSPRCYQTVRGYVAERHLEQHLETLQESGEIDGLEFLDGDGKPDFQVIRGGRSFFIECKNVLRKTRFANGDMKVDFQRTRNQLGKGGRAGRFYKINDFDVLAACEYNQLGTWSFQFVRTEDLPCIVVDGVSCIVKSVRVGHPEPLDGWSRNLVDTLRSPSWQRVE